jgi:hypothetical protein
MEIRDWSFLSQVSAVTLITFSSHSIEYDSISLRWVKSGEGRIEGKKDLNRTSGLLSRPGRFDRFLLSQERQWRMTISG